jgi:protein-disulfide isomerase
LELYWILTTAGFAVSVLSALEGRVQWVASFCALFGEGCRRTEDFSWLGIPLSWWGLGYYAALGSLIYFKPGWIFWLVMAGFGFELTFLGIMAAIRAFCIFCLLNAVVVAGLVWIGFDPARIWPGAGVALTFFAVSFFFISKENASRISPGPARGADADVDIEGRPALGPERAPVVVVEFSDPLCPACRAANETTARIREDYGDRIRWVFKDFPLDSHPGARKAAEAAHCAGEQGKFWEYHDMVVDSGEESPDDGRLKEYAASLDLHNEPFVRCLGQGKYRSRIEEDIRQGKQAGISAIPAFVVNGRVLSGNLSFDEFSEAIEEELKAAAAPSENR